MTEKLAEQIEFERALTALALEVPGPVHDDVIRLYKKLIAAFAAADDECPFDCDYCRS